MKQLRVFLTLCPACRLIYTQNVATICDDNGNLTEDQADIVLAQLIAQHKDHV